MAAPNIKITSQARVGLALDVEGWITGNPSSASVTLPAAATPAGAVTKSNIPIAVRPNGFFSVRLSSVSAGFYDAPVVTAANADGTTTASGIPQRIYANGAAPVGHPVVTFPPRATPTPAPSIVLGAAVTDVSLVSTYGSAQSNLPFTFGQPFKKGELAPTDYLVGRIAGEADIPLQFNVKSTHPDGSVRHAIISGVLPALSGNDTQEMALHRAASSSVSHVPIAASAVTGAGFSASITVTVDGVAYSANAADGIASAQPWFGGAIATDFAFLMPMVDGGGNTHAHLTAYFSVRFYPGQNKAKVDMAIEHAKAFTALSDVTYDVQLVVGGTQVFTQDALVHFPRARWKKTFWWNGPPALYVKRNRDYLIDSRAVSHYDRRIDMSETTLQGYVADIALSKFAPMKPGRMHDDTTGPGAKPYLGLAPDTHAAYVLSTDKRAFDIMLAQADAGGSYPIHLRDTGAGPASGHPLDINHYPKFGIGNAGDSGNTSTGVSEYSGPLVTTSPLKQDTAHQPALAYIPYLVTGDHYYLEELLFWSHYNHISQNPGAINLTPSVPGSYYREHHRGRMNWSQVRAQAWGMRSLAQAAAITPDDHPSKASLQYWVEGNIENWNALYTDNSTPNELHIINSAGAIIYQSDRTGELNTGIANFQEDFWAQALNHVRELGYEAATRLLTWKVKWQVDRMIGVGSCWTNAALYNATVRNTSSSALYTSIGQVLSASLSPELNALPCGSQARLDQLNAERALPSNAYLMNDMTGYAYSADGFVSNLQPALAAAVDIGYPDADLAWDLFDGRAVKPDRAGNTYSDMPQFSIIPRQAEPQEPLPLPAPPDNYVFPAGQPMYFGMLAPS